MKHKEDVVLLLHVSRDLSKNDTSALMAICRSLVLYSPYRITGLKHFINRRSAATRDPSQRPLFISLSVRRSIKAANASDINDTMSENNILAPTLCFPASL